MRVFKRLRFFGLARKLALLAALAAAPLLPVQPQTLAGTASVPTAPRVFSEPELDQMLAPIALYPDELLAQMLMAATYPLEIVQADRWLQDPAHAGLRGSQLAQAVQQQPWDDSVRALTAFPQVLAAMDNNLDWTEELGDAFLAQQAQVMDRVQHLRAMAQSARNLNSSPQQTVTNGPQTVEIGPPPDSDMVYVPEYDPSLSYGPWPYPDYPPYDFELANYVPGGYMGFFIVLPLWGWAWWDWGHHQIGVGPPGWRPPVGVRPPRPGTPWTFNPGHRHGVPYRDEAVRSRYESDAGRASAAQQFRGYAPPEPPAAAMLPARPGAGHAPAVEPARTPSPVPAPRAPAVAPEPVRPAPPAFESFGHGGEVHVQEQRGMSSRMSAPIGGGGRERR
jgi:hypothetical protein